MKKLFLLLSLCLLAFLPNDGNAFVTDLQCGYTEVTWYDAPAIGLENSTATVYVLHNGYVIPYIYGYIGTDHSGNAKYVSYWVGSGVVEIIGGFIYDKDSNIIKSISVYIDQIYYPICYDYPQSLFLPLLER